MSFINKLVSAATGKSYNSEEHLLDDLNKVASNNQGGIFLGGNTVNNAFFDGKGNPTIRIANNNPTLEIHRNAQVIATTLLHELIHIVSNKGDQFLDEKIQGLGIIPMRWDGPMGYPPTDGNYSAYWGTALKNACFQNIN